MTSEKTLWVALIAVAIIAISSWFHTSTQVGGVTNNDNLQLSKIGTSTLTQVGCIQTYATSTVTSIVLNFGVIGTTSITGATPSNGMVLWSYGSCGSPVGL